MRQLLQHSLRETSIVIREAGEALTMIAEFKNPIVSVPRPPRGDDPYSTPYDPPSLAPPEPGPSWFEQMFTSSPNDLRHAEFLGADPLVSALEPGWWREGQRFESLRATGREDLHVDMVTNKNLAVETLLLAKLPVHGIQAAGPRIRRDISEALITNVAPLLDQPTSLLEQ